MNNNSTDIDNRGASIGMQLIAERVYFGGDEPAPPERDALARLITSRFAQAVERGGLDFDARVELEHALQRLIGRRGEWIAMPYGRLASVTVSDRDHDNLRLPLELLRPPTGSDPVVVRCGLAESETVPRGPHDYPEGGRIVVATSDAGGPVPEAALLDAVRESCRAGLHLASDLDHDRKRGAFDPRLDYRPRASRHDLRQILGPGGDRPGATVLLLACHVRDDGLCLHDGDSDTEVRVGAEGLAAALAPFASHLRLVVLVPVAGQSAGDPGRVVVDTAMALHRRGMAAVAAPRVPLPGAVVPGMTAVLLRTLLGDTEVPPGSLESALARVVDHLGTKDGLARLGLRLYARAADGDDTRPLVIRPYRGLLSFEPEHTRFYVGRERETEEAVDRLAELHGQGLPQLLLLVGATGVGKSSLAKAGVAPAMAQDGWTTVLTRPAQHSAQQLETLVEDLSAERTLVVVDQLEELFTETESHRHATDYLHSVWALATRDDTAVIATLRIDALDVGAKIQAEPGGRTLEQLIPGPHAVFIHHMDADAIRRVIAEPARRVGLGFDPGLVDRLCAETLAEPGALPMLELVLDEIWSSREGRRLIAAAHRGGLAERLTRYADRCVARLPDEQRAQAQRILVRLATGPVVELTAWRRRSTLDALRPTHPNRRAAFDAALAALVEARLVVRGNLRQPLRAEAPEQVSTAAESIELAHELLLRRWDTLHEWLDEAAPRLAAVRDLERWVADRREHRTTLLTLEKIAYIEQADLPEDELNDSMIELIEASRKAVRRGKWLRRAFVGALIVASSAFAGLSDWAEDQRAYLQEKTRHANRQTKRADEETAAAKKNTEDAKKQTEIAKDRLGQATAFANWAISQSLPKLGLIPQMQGISYELYDHLQEMLFSLRATDPETEHRGLRIEKHIQNAEHAWRADDDDGARREFELAVSEARRLIEDSPSYEMPQFYLFNALARIGQLGIKTGDLATARRYAQRSVVMAEQWSNADSRSELALFCLSQAYGHLGTANALLGDLPAARRSLRQSRETAGRMTDENPFAKLAEDKLYSSYTMIGGMELQAGNLSTARDYLERSLKLTEELAYGEPPDSEAKGALRSNLYLLGKVELNDGNRQLARSYHQRSVRVAKELVKANAVPRGDLSASLYGLAKVELHANNLDEARNYFQGSLNELPEPSADAPQSAQNQRDRALSLEGLGDVEMRDGNLKKARDYFQRSLDIRKRLTDPSTGSSMKILGGQLQFDVVTSLDRLANLEQEEGNIARYRQHVAEAIERLDALDEKGQLDDYEEREESRKAFARRAAELAIPLTP